MSDWSKPTLTSTYTNFLAEMSNRVNDAAKQNRSDTVTLTSPPVGLIRWNETSKRWEDNTGTVATPVWSPLASTYAINVATADALKTGRTVSLTGDATGTSASWTGSANLSIAATLATVNSSPSTYGSASLIPVVTVNGKGLVTSVSTVSIGSVATQSASAVAITGGTISGTNISLKQGTTAAPTAEGYIEWDTDNDTLMLGTGAATLTFAPLAPAGVVTMTNHTFGSGCTWGGNAVPVANGGTGSTTATAARTALGIGSMGTQNSSAISVSGGSMSGVNITLKQSTTAAPTAEGIVEWDTDNDLLVVGNGTASKIFAPINSSVDVTVTNHIMSTNCTWNGDVLSVQYGGTGVATLSGVAFGNGTGAMTAATATQLRSALGTLPAANGGSGQSSYTVGDLLYASGAAALSKLASVATGNVLRSGGVATAPSWGKVALTTDVSGVLPVANGGTGATSIAGFVYGNGTGAFTAASAAQIGALGFPAGTKMPFAQAAAPTGWTQLVTDSENNRMLRVVNTTGGGVGGLSNPIWNNVVPAHTHGFVTGWVSSDHTHITTAGFGANWSGINRVNLGIGQDAAYIESGGTSANHYHSGTTDNGSSQTNWEPRYINMIICQKN